MALCRDVPDVQELLEDEEMQPLDECECEEDEYHSEKLDDEKEDLCPCPPGSHCGNCIKTFNNTLLLYF